MLSKRVLNCTNVSGALRFSTVRFFWSSNISSAKQSPKPLGGKKKVKQGFKTKNDAKSSKTKKGGMTHLKFREAVQSLKFERLAKSLDTTNIKELDLESLENLSNTLVKYHDSTEEVLRSLGAFKGFQHHELFNRPISLVTHCTTKLSSSFLSGMDGPSKENRFCLLGEKGSGKSTMLTQMKALAHSKSDSVPVFLHFDYPQKIIDGSSDYIYNNKIEKYQQPMFTKRWIIKTRNANEQVFNKLKLSRDITFTSKKVTHQLKKNENTLYDFLALNHDFGKFSATNAFSFFVEELMHHSKDVPILVTIDDFNCLTGDPKTRYRHPNFKPIKFNEFEMGDFILKLASGDMSFDKGGILLAESKDVSESFTLPVGLGLKKYDPYFTQDVCDYEIANSLLQNGGIKSFTVDNLFKNEARSLLEFWKTVGVMHLRPEDTTNTSPKSTTEQSKTETNIKSPNSDEFEKLFQTYFLMSSGNPGCLLKSVALSY